MVRHQFIASAIAGLLVLFIASVAFGQGRKGQSEISTYANLSTQTTSVDQGEDTTTSFTTIAFNYANFVSERVQLGVSIMIQGTESDAASSTATFTEGLLRFYFFNENEDAAFYVGPTLGVMSIFVEGSGFQSNGSGTTTGFFGGGKWWLSENFTFNLEYFSKNSEITLETTVSGSFETTTTDISVNTSGFLLGFSYFFGGEGGDVESSGDTGIEEVEEKDE